MNLVAYYKDADAKYINVNFILKNNKIYYERKKLTNNYNLNKNVIKDFISKEIEGIIVDDKVEFATDDFKQYLTYKEKLKEMKKYNHMKNENKI